MFGSKKDKEEKAKKKIIDIDEEKGTTIEYQDRRSSSKSAGEKGEIEEELAVVQETEAGEGVEEEVKPDEEGDRAAELLDQLQRLQAEFDNYRKRVQKERLESWNVAKRDMVMSLLPFMDDIVRVLDWDDHESEPTTLLEGMKLTANKFMSILREEGLEPVEAEGKPFDPNFHEALMTEVVDEPDRDNLVAEVLVEGYLFKGILLRPARVKVLKYSGDDKADTGRSGDENGEVGDPVESKDGDNGE